ncbi:MAG: hypothetical protein ACYTF1_02780 [Planctomycetota bacterium]|jgi:TctA family transporter
MTNLLSKILLAMLMFPLAVVVFVITLIPMIDEIDPFYALLWADIIAAFFVACYWIILWQNTVRWTQYRIIATVLSSLGCLTIGSILGLVVGSFMEYEKAEFSVLFAGIFTILLWLITTILLWRETPTERAERVKLSAGDVIFCLKCGYNMTGLHQSKCPECGTKYTVDKLLAGQSHKTSQDTTA